MPGGLARSRPPREYAAHGEAWPDGPLEGDAAVHAVAQVATALSGVLAERGLSHRQAAELTGVNRQTINELVAGRTWPDVATVARLAAGLGVDLWPRASEGIGIEGIGSER